MTYNCSFLKGGEKKYGVYSRKSGLTAIGVIRVLG